jgi:hypothetical protein
MEPLAFQLLTDGTRRPIYDDGVSQWVEDENGKRVYGMWYIPREECDAPIVILDEVEPAGFRFSD